MSGSSRKKRAKRAARAAAARQEAERARIKAETESMQRGMGEEIAGRRRARLRGGAGLLGSASIGMGSSRVGMGVDEETLG